MKLRELLFGIGFEVDDKQLKKAEGTLTNFKGFVTKIGAVVAGASAAISGMAYITGGLATELYNTSSGLALTTEELQKLQYAGNKAGVSTDEMSSALESLNSSAWAMMEGNQSAITSFGRFGVTVVDTNGKMKDTDQLLYELSDSFKKMPDGPRKAALATEIFGSSGRKMYRMLNQGSGTIKQAGQQLKDFGGIMSKEGIKNGLEFTDSLKSLWALVKAVYSQIAQKLLPVVTNAINSFMDWVIVNQELLLSGLDQFFEVLIHLIKTTWSWVSKILSVFGLLIKAVVKTTNVFGGLANILKVVISLISLYMVGALGVMAGSLLHSIKLFIVFNGGIAKSILLLKTMGITALKSWMKTLGPMIIVAAKFILIGAAIAGVILLFQDLYTWITKPLANSFFKDMFGDFDEFKQKAKDVASEIWIFPELFDEIGKTWDNTIGELKIGEMFSDAWDSAKDSFSDIAQMIKKMFSGAIDYIFGGKLYDVLKETIKSIKSYLVDSFLQGLMSVVNFVKNGITGITEIVKDPVGTLKKVGSNIKEKGGNLISRGIDFAKGLFSSGDKPQDKIKGDISNSVKNNNNSNAVKNDIKLNINAKTNASAKDIANETMTALKSALVKQNFETSVATQTAEVY